MGHGPTNESQSNVLIVMKFSINALLFVTLNKFIQVVELVVVQIMGIVEDERTFNNFTFMKTSSTISCVNIWTLLSM
jgi:hypothetical protein